MDYHGHATENTTREQRAFIKGIVVGDNDNQSNRG